MSLKSPCIQRIIKVIRRQFLKTKKIEKFTNNQIWTLFVLKKDINKKKLEEFVCFHSIFRTN